MSKYIHIYIHICMHAYIHMYTYICVGMRVVSDGWFKQPDLAESDWTLGLGEAAHLLHVE